VGSLASYRYPIEEIRARCDLAEIVSAYVTLKRVGKRLVGLCPFHAEKTPSFYVNPEMQRYKCFGCGEAGDVISFLMRAEGLTFPEAAEQLARKTGVELKRSAAETRSAGERERILRVNNLATVYFRKMLGKSGFAQDYCRARGITEEAIEKYKLGYAPDGWTGLAEYLSSRVEMKDALRAGLVGVRSSGSGYYDVFRNRLMFPITDVQDRVIGFGGRTLGDDQAKYINSSETPLFAKSRTLYGLNLARKAISAQDRAILVEGYLDVITVQMAGFDNAVAPMGTAITREHVLLLSRYTHNVVLAYDSDSAGMAAAERGARMFEELDMAVRVAQMPPGEDPDSLLRNGDPSVFARAINEAVPLADWKLNRIAEKHDLNKAEERRAALSEAIAVVAEVESPIERERLIRELVKYHPGRSTGEVVEELQIRREVERARSKRRPGHSAPVGSADAAARRLTAAEKAERALLGILIEWKEPAERVFAQLRPEEFVTVEGRTLAAAVQELSDRTGKFSVEELSQAVAGTPAETLLTEMLVGGRDASWQSGVSMADLVRTIVVHRKKQKMERFRTLAEKFERGELTKDTEEFAEYWALVHELHK